MSEANTAFWRKCTSCKKPIALGAEYYVCSVSSCNKKSAPSQFCSFPCWSVHNEVYNHRNAAAVQEKAPLKADPVSGEVTTGAATKSSAPATAARASTSTSSSSSTSSSTSMSGKSGVATETLVVVSKVKKYIADSAGLNTAQGVMDALSDHIVRICDRAAENARAEGRKTVLERDVPPA